MSQAEVQRLRDPLERVGNERDPRITSLDLSDDLGRRIARSCIKDDHLERRVILRQDRFEASGDRPLLVPCRHEHRDELGGRRHQ
jgi:hypothetical protein